MKASKLYRKLSKGRRVVEGSNEGSKVQRGFDEGSKGARRFDGVRRYSRRLRGSGNGYSRAGSLSVGLLNVTPKVVSSCRRYSRVSRVCSKVRRVFRGFNEEFEWHLETSKWYKRTELSLRRWLV